MVEVIFEGEACVDCVVFIANADTSGVQDFETWWKGVQSIGLDRLGSVVVACEDDCEGWFGTSGCDYCGDHLHGDRHPIVVLGEV